MDIKSLIKYLSFRDKIRIASIDPVYRDLFLKTERPPKEYYDRAFDNDDVKGFTALLLFHKDVHSLENTHKLIRRSLHLGKLRLVKWLLKMEGFSVKDEKSKYFVREIKRLVSQCKQGNFRIHERFKGFIKKYDYDHWEISRNISDVIMEDNAEKFSNMYRSLSHRDFSIKHLLGDVVKNGARNIYMWLFENIGYDSEFISHSKRHGLLM